MMPEALFKPEIKIIKEHLTILFNRCEQEAPNTLINMNRGEVKGDGWGHALFPTNAEGIQNASLWAVDWNTAGWNIYTGINPIKEGTNPNVPVINQDVAGAFFNFADLDSEESVKIAQSGMPLFNTYAVITGTTPHNRVHLYWEHECFTKNINAWVDTQKGIRNYFVGDAVIDPRRIMRLAGTINYPKRDKTDRGYKTEMVTLRTQFEDGPRDPISPAVLHRTYAGIPSSVSASENTPSDGGLGLPGTFSGADVQQLMEDISNGTEWHNNVCKLTAHWVARGWSDAEMIVACRSFTLPGYTQEDTDNEVNKAIQGARQKWDHPNPTHEVGPTAPAAVNPAWDDLAQRQGKVPDILDNETGEAIDRGDPASMSMKAWLKRDIPPRDYTLGSVMCTTSRWMLYGQTGLGKTLFTFNMAAAIAAGKPFLGWEAGKPRRVMYLDGEMPAETFKERVLQVTTVYGEDIQLFGLNRDDLGDDGMPPLNTPEGEAWLITQIEKFNPDLIVFDSIMCLLSGNMKEEEPWEPIKAMIRKITSLRIAQVWMDHAGHNATKAYGTSTKMWEMDTVIRLEKPQSDEPGFTVAFEKARLRTDKNAEEFTTQHVALENNVWTYKEAKEGGTKKANLATDITTGISNLVASGVGRERLGLDKRSTVIAILISDLRDALKQRGLLQTNEQNNLTSGASALFHRTGKDLIAAGKVAIDGKEMWLISKGLSL